MAVAQPGAWHCYGWLVRQDGGQICVALQQLPQPRMLSTAAIRPAVVIIVAHSGRSCRRPVLIRALASVSSTRSVAPRPLASAAAARGWCRSPPCYAAVYRPAAQCRGKEHGSPKWSGFAVVNSGSVVVRRAIWRVRLPALTTAGRSASSGKPRHPYRSGGAVDGGSIVLDAVVDLAATAA